MENGGCARLFFGQNEEYLGMEGGKEKSLKSVESHALTRARLESLDGGGRGEGV